MIRPSSAEFFLQNTVEAARQLIGARLVCVKNGRELTGRIIETEAYRQDDPASHSYRGLTPRTAPMFEDGGIAYVYFIYGMYHCFNVVTELAGKGCAVLIRGVEPISGVETMWRNRYSGRKFEPAKVSTLSNGPGKLCRAFGIGIGDSGVSVITGDIKIQFDDTVSVGEIGISPRIGIKKGVDLPWRFYEKPAQLS